MNEQPKEDANSLAKEDANSLAKEGEPKEENDQSKKNSLKENGAEQKPDRKNSLKAEKPEKPEKNDQPTEEKKGDDKENAQRNEKPDELANGKPNENRNGNRNEKRNDRQEIGMEQRTDEPKELADQKEENPRISSDEFDQAVELIRAHLKCIEKLQHVIVRNLYKEKTSSNSSLKIRLECSDDQNFLTMETRFLTRTKIPNFI